MPGAALKALLYAGFTTVESGDFSFHVYMRLVPRGNSDVLS